MWRIRDNILIQLSFICFFVIYLHTVVCNLSIATIRNGTLIGITMHTRLGRDIHAFLGIPYAAPPIGELRFAPPQPATAWNGVRAAVENAEICTQRNIYTYQEEIVGGEDCLYLNVYTPRIPYSETPLLIAHRYPVMIWFHGGGWLTGAGHSEFYGPKFLLDHDLVLVTINFRLGPLGFLSTEDLECPGNLGLKDQQQAMRWVQENIVSFGGDPNRVTLFGESAGGASVHYHMINPISQGLFHRGISQSGNFYNPWTLTPPESAKEKAIILGRNLSCNTDTSAELIKCLRTKDATEIIGTDRLFQMYSDAWFNHGTHEAIKDFIANQTSPIYYYYFAYKGSASFSWIFGDTEKNYGVSHADELQYLFPVGEQLFKDTELSKEDHKIINIMTELWYNFANSG
ncbi:hypothetical protein ACFW04_005044 [Cataglyphis niger]